MMEDWRIRNNSRFHVPPGILRRRANGDGEERYCEDAPTYRCFSSPAFAKLLFAMILLSILSTTTVPSFQTWELGHLRLWRWQLVAFFAFYGRFISCAITNGVLHVIENSNDARVKGNLPHAYAVKKTFQDLLSFAILLTAWFLLIEGIPLKKIGNITKILSCVVVSMFIWGFKIVVCKVVSISFHRRNYLEQIKEAVFSLYILRTMLTPLKDSNQMTEEREVIVAAAPNNRRGHKLLQGRMTFCQRRLVSTDTLNDWGVWNMVNIVQNAHALDEMLWLLPHRRCTRPNLNTWDDKAMSVFEESRTSEKHRGLELSLDDTHRGLRSLPGTVYGVVLAILSFAWLAILNTAINLRYVLPRYEEIGQTIYIAILFLALAVAFVYHFYGISMAMGLDSFSATHSKLGKLAPWTGKRCKWRSWAFGTQSF